MSPSMLTTSVMAVRDYERALAVLGRCADVESVENLQEEFLEALASVYGCIHTAFFQTDSFTLTVADPHPVLNGATVRIINEYRDRWYTEDVMFTPCSLDHIRRSGVSALCQLTRQSIPESGAEYLEAFLFRHGLHSACALDLDLPGGQRGVIGIFHEDADSLGPADLAGFSVIVRQLSSVSRRLRAPATARPGSDALHELPPRLRQVVDLVGRGHTNAAIARQTGIKIDTVKKYVSQALDRTECHNRTELALLANVPQLRLARPGW
jgi:DNA-binding CsgD family transcriptional regulator